MRTLLLAAAAVLGVSSVPAQAAIDMPVPTENYITIDGLDWAWAAPCAAYGNSCGVVDLSYQSTQGWRIPTLAEFLARPTVNAFGGKCASAWFSTQHSHCDFSDPYYNTNGTPDDQPFGALFDFGYGITDGGSQSYAETWLVRGASVNPGVPEAATWAMMIAGFGLVGASMRRRRTVAA